MIIDFWSILIIVFIFQGLFLLLSLLTSVKRRKKHENPFLVLIVVILLWFLFEFLSVRNRLNVGVNIFYGVRYGSWLFLGPIVFFYFKSITDSRWSISKMDVLHLVPFLLLALVTPVLFSDILSKRQVDYGMLSVFDYREKIITPIQYIYSFVFVGQFIHFGFYLYKSLGLMNNYSKVLKSEYASINKNVKWLKTLLISLLLVLLLTTLFLFILLKTDIYRRHLDYLYSLPIGFLFYLIGFHLINSEWKSVVNKEVKYANSTLNIESLPIYSQKLNHLIEVDKVYLDNKIRLSELAKKMNISSHHLSQIINQYYELSFFDFINMHRINAAKKSISKDPEKPLITIAYDSGFNNKTSFINCFKKFEKTTPSKYLESVKGS